MIPYRNGVFIGVVLSGVNKTLKLLFFGYLSCEIATYTCLGKLEKAFVIDKNLLFLVKLLLYSPPKNSI